MELVRFKKVTNQAYWFYSKAMFLFVGGLGALAALFTGDTAREAVQAGEFAPAITNFKAVVSMHENFADLSVAIFGILALCYLVLWLNRENLGTRLGLTGTLQKMWLLKIKVAHFIVETPFVILMAVLGLICITITGGLGGTMVYGTQADPFFGIIYKLMFP